MQGWWLLCPEIGNKFLSWRYILCRWCIIAMFSHSTLGCCAPGIVVSNQIYKKQWPPISIRPTHPKQETWTRTYPRHHDITETSQQNLTTNPVRAAIHPILPSTQTAHSRAICRWPKPNISTDLWRSGHTTPCQIAQLIAVPIPSHDSLPISWDQPTSTTGTYKSQMNILHFLIYSQQPNVLWLNIAIIHQWHDM
jgi:hypothetical protein